MEIQDQEYPSKILSIARQMIKNTVSNENDNSLVKECIWHDVKVSLGTQRNTTADFRLENFWSTADQRVPAISLGNWHERQADRPDDLKAWNIDNKSN